MKRIASLVILVLCSYMLTAQVQIVVQKGEVANFYFDLKEAVTEAESGSTIYLPAGVFEVVDFSINKQLRIIGIGHNPSSNPNNTYTEVKGEVLLKEGASGCSFEGLKMNNTWRLGRDEDKASIVGVNFSRCYFENNVSLFLSDGDVRYPVKELVFHECILPDMIGGHVGSVLFLKNIFSSSVTSFKNGATFRNNIFSKSRSAFTFFDVKQASFENNIFLCSFSGIESSILLNNIFLSGYDYNFTDVDNIESENITGILLEDLFVNVTSKTFEYFHDYQLSVRSGGTNGGTDNTDIGLFGTTQPFRETGVPDVPHIDSYTIGSATDNQGRLTINVKVSAQGN